MKFHKENGKWVATYKGEQAIDASLRVAGELVLSVVKAQGVTTN